MTFDEWFDTKCPKDEDGRRPTYQNTMVMDLMRMAWQGAFEQSATLCDEISNDFNRRRKTSDNPTYMEGKSDGAEDCATALLRVAGTLAAKEKANG